MQYRTMPKSEDKLSVLGFGCMRLPSRSGNPMISPVDPAEAKKQIVHAIENGLNYLDTAWPYHRGDSERFLGQHIVPEYRDKVYIATKLPCFSIGSRKKMDEVFGKQLQKLQTDYIDYYLMHSLDGANWDKMVSLGAVDFMDEIRRDKKVRHIGFSFHGDQADFIRIVDDYDWDFVQVQMNILDENFQAGMKGIRYAAGKNMGVIAMEPLRGGALVGKMPHDVKKVYDHASVRRSAADWAFSWLYNMPEVTLVLSGMNDMAHIDENLAVADKARPGMLSKQELGIVHAARDAFRGAMAISCTGCAYCMPCPQGINIPGALKNLNDFHMFGKFAARVAHWQHTGMRTEDGTPRWAGTCTECGACEKQCPQNLQIIDALKQVDKKLEGPFGKIVSAAGRRVIG